MIDLFVITGTAMFSLEKPPVCASENMVLIFSLCPTETFGEL